MTNHKALLVALILLLALAACRPAPARNQNSTIVMVTSTPSNQQWTLLSFELESEKPILNTFIYEVGPNEVGTSKLSCDPQPLDSTVTIYPVSGTTIQIKNSLLSDPNGLITDRYLGFGSSVSIEYDIAYRYRIEQGTEGYFKKGHAILVNPAGKTVEAEIQYEIGSCNAILNILEKYKP